MILSDSMIEWALEHKQIRIDPILLPIQPNSVDLRLYNQILIPKGNHLIDTLYGISHTDKPRTFAEYSLDPGDFVCVSTLEWVEIGPQFVGVLSGKSRWARFGLQVECAGWVDSGWKGRLTLELANLGKDIIVLRPGMPICQIAFMRVEGKVTHQYGDVALRSHYQESDGVRGGVIDPMDFGPDQ